MLPYFSALSRSVQCVIALKKVCPDEHADIMTVIEGPVINVADLCNVDNLIESKSLCVPLTRQPEVNRS